MANTVASPVDACAGVDYSFKFEWLKDTSH
jgi:hypothetical protein